MTTIIPEEFRKIPYMKDTAGLDLDAFHYTNFEPVTELELNYKPVICRSPEEADEDGYHVEGDGIGGSDAGAFLGLNENRPPHLAALQKLGIVPRQEPDPGLQYIFDFGHQMEVPLIALFAGKFGIKCWRDRAQYQHPLFPWMKADMDGFCQLPTGEIAILECKTHSTIPMIADKWHTGVYGMDGKLGRPEYIAQAAHDMAVCNLNQVIFLAGCDNSPDHLTVVRVFRDLDFETELINVEGRAWASMMQTEMPPETDILSDAAYDTIARAFTVKRPDRAEPLVLPDSDLEVVNEIEDLETQLKAAKKAADAVEERLNAAKAKLVETTGGAENARCGDYVITFKASPRESVNTNKLKIGFPDIYEQVKKVSITKPILKIKKRKGNE